MRIGDVLLARGWVDPAGLSRAIAEQKHTGRRLCSMLISRGMLDHDEAARALAEQRGMPGVLLRHLEGREPGLAHLIPAELARTHVALPIGRSGNNELIVCVRDQNRDLRSMIERITRTTVLLAITPASRLEQIVAAVYGEGKQHDFDVDLTTGPITLPILDAMDLLDSAIPQFKLVDLDDSRVAKDHTQSGAYKLPNTARATMPPAPARPVAPNLTPLGGVPALAASPASSARTQLPAPAPTLDATITALEAAATRDDATDIAMAYVAGRWGSSLLVTIKDGAALGHRGHGPQIGSVETIALPMSSPSMLKIAHDTKRATAEVPGGAIQERLGRMLGSPTAPAAAPIIVATRAIGAIAVGDSLHGVGDTVDATTDLECVAEALGLAYARILLEAKRG